MSHAATWKILEDLMIELKKKGATIPPTVINDLRSAKLMIKISESADNTGALSQKVDEYLGNIESSLITEAQKILGTEIIDRWLKLLEDATAQISDEKIEENKFITNVPRDQKWIRIEPISNLSTARIEQIAKESDLSVNPQKDGRLVVYGQQEGIRDFLKKITLETTKK